MGPFLDSKEVLSNKLLQARIEPSLPNPEVEHFLSLNSATQQSSNTTSRKTGCLISATCSGGAACRRQAPIPSVADLGRALVLKDTA